VSSRLLYARCVVAAKKFEELQGGHKGGKKDKTPQKPAQQQQEKKQEKKKPEPKKPEVPPAKQVNYMYIYIHVTSSAKLIELFHK